MTGLLLIDNAPVIGGVAVTLRNVVPQLEARGFKVTLAIPETSVAAAAWYRAGGIDVRSISLPPIRSPAAWVEGGWGVSSLVRALHPDLVHAHSTRAGLAALGARLRVRFPLIWSVHESRVPLLQRLALPLASVVVVRSNDQLRRHRWFRTGNITVVPAGVPDGAIDDAARAAARKRIRRELGFDENCLLIGAVGTLTWWKGHKTLVRAIPAIRDRHPDVRFVFVGGGSPHEPDYARMLEDLAASLGVDERVVFAGFRQDAPTVIAALDVFVHPNIRPESSGMSIADAMSASVPVVASHIGPTAELLTHERELLMFSAGEPEALAAAVVRLVEEPELAAELARGAREYYERALRIEGEVDAYVELYERLVAAGPRKDPA